MSTIRFIHVDHLRLAGAPTGISDAPAWLRNLACDSVRNSVRNVIEVAVAQDAEFLLIAGRITESTEDLESVAQWLDDQFETLRHHGIRIVATARDSREAEVLERICSVVVRSGESLCVTSGVTERWRLAASAENSFASTELVVSFSDDRVGGAGNIYTALPSIKPSEARDCRSLSGSLGLSAGAVQAIAPAETWSGGCVVVDVDVTSREIQSQFHACDILRYATEELCLPSPASAEALAVGIAKASDLIRKNVAQTIIVDWRISAELITELSDVSRLDELALLLRLRNDLQSGHLGAWPRRVSFSDSSRLKLMSEVGEAVDQYVSVVSGSARALVADGFTHQRLELHNGNGVDATLIAGLQLLGRVA